MEPSASPERKSLSLNGLQLKLYGWVFTLTGAAAMAFFPQDSTGAARVVMLLLSYLALPVFAFLLVEGFLHTQDFKRYLILVFAAALVAEPFFDYACTGSWFALESSNGQNMLFALALGLAELYFLRYMGVSSVGKVIASILMVIASALWAFLLNIKCGIYLAVIIGLFYLLRQHKLVRNLTVAAVSLFGYFTPVISLLPVSGYSGERGRFNKYIFYILYPAMWAVLAIIKLLIK